MRGGGAMRVAVAHNAVSGASSPDERDVLVQAEAVAGALRALGHSCWMAPCDLNLADFRARLEAKGPDLVFNLVETLEGQGRLIHLAPALFEAMGLAYTGAQAEAVFLTSNKLLAKERLAGAGLPTPSWIAPGRLRLTWVSGKGTWIIKSVWEHASVGLEEDSLLAGVGEDAVAAAVTERAARLGGEAFAERFIEGREFNLSVLAGAGGPEVLPPAEIVFKDFPAGKPRIVGYRAKWAADSFEYQNTVRRFDFPARDEALLAELKTLALRCWGLFRLRGYARVDFRVDGEGRPWILEVNTNPCLSPDAGFAAAVERAGMGLTEAVGRIVEDARPAVGGKRAAAESVSKPAPDLSQWTVRYEPRPGDVESVMEVAKATGFFTTDEVKVAGELVEERLAKGEGSGYFFVFAEAGGRLAGYACYGPAPCTVSSYDLYWIMTHPDFQGKGLGKAVLREAERLIAEAGGAQVYAETSGKAQYASTRAFYEKCGYEVCSTLEDFYAPGDAKVTYVRRVGRG